MILVGEMSLWIALLMASWTVIVSGVGGAAHKPELVASGERGIRATLVLLGVASTGLWTALFTRDFSIWYVAAHTTANLPTIYSISAFWAGRGGSFLLWTMILCGCSLIVLHADWDDNRELMPYVTAIIAAVILLFLGSIVLVESPFERLNWTPPEGQGMSPELQSPAMAAYLPALYTGYAATTIPFAFSAAALIVRRLTPAWLDQVRRWALVAWFFMTVGILVGMNWAYLEPDRPGHWAWHPVETAALLPWLVTTAFLISLTLQESRGVVRKWNVILLMSGFLLAVFATLSPGSGTISGVRSLAHAPGGVWIAAAFAAAIVVAGVLVIDRLTDLELGSSRKTVPGGGKRSRHGGYVTAFGMVALLVALAAQLWRKEHAVELRTGETAELADPYGGVWRFVSEGISRYQIVNRRVTAVTMSVYLNGAPAGLLTTERRQYADSRGAPTHDPATEAGVIRTARQDVYAALGDVAGEDTVRLRIAFNPLVWLIWVGGAAVALGGLIVWWVRRDAPRGSAYGVGAGG